MCSTGRRRKNSLSSRQKKPGKLRHLTAEEIDAEYEKFAAQYGMEVEKIKEQLLKEDVHYHLTLKKALDMLREKAVITEKTITE